MTQRTLYDIWKNDPGLQAEFPDVNKPGKSGNWTINDWWNKYGKIDYADVELIQPTAASYSDSEGNALGRFASGDPTPQDPETDTNTVWLYNKKSQTYRPVSSVTALMALTQSKTPAEAFSYVTSLSSSALNDSAWKGKFISIEDAVLDDGKIPSTSTLISGQDEALSGLYGATQRYDADVETYIGNLIGVILTPALQKGDISQTVFDKNTKDPAKLAQYINAILYGGYNIPDAVYKDLKAQTLAENGNSGFANYKAFDTGIKADVWNQTEEGKKNAANTTLEPPSNVLNIDVGLFKNGIFEIPGEAFSTLIKPVDINSQEFKDEAAKIQASYYDIQMQKASAETEQDKAQADANWETFKTNLKKKFNIDLSNNAREAWAQIQSIISGADSKGLAGSGLAQEAQDKYLRDVREKNTLLRETYSDELDDEKKNWLTTSGSAEDIRAFVAESAENKEKAERWGLIPSDEQKSWYSKDNLKKLYPDMSDADIEKISSMMIDENGNYRSQLYQNLYWNKYDLGEKKKSYQQEKLLAQKEDEEEKAYAPYTTSNPLSSYKPKDSTSTSKSSSSTSSTAQKTSTTYNPQGNLSATNLDAYNNSQKSSSNPSSQRKLTSLLDVYESRPDLQQEFSSTSSKGKSGDWDLNEWWNRYGKQEYSNYDLTDRDKVGNNSLYEKKPIKTVK